ncbi:MAG: HepT-like ribonuclease domain-containing protein [Candidatus Hydrogenedentota bacterium]
MTDDRYLLLHVLDACEIIHTILTRDSRALFEDRILRDAILRNLHTLTESTQKLSEDVKRRASGVPWIDIGRFRNVVVHHYLGLDLVRIQRVIDEQLPVLEEAVRLLLKDYDET